MSNQKKVVTKNQLDLAVEALYVKLSGIDPVEKHELYDKIVSEIVRLEGLRIDYANVKQGEEKWFGIDANTIVNAVVGIGSILLILNYEKTDVLTSKASGVAMKMIGK